MALEEIRDHPLVDGYESQLGLSCCENSAMYIIRIQAIVNDVGNILSKHSA